MKLILAAVLTLAATAAMADEGRYLPTVVSGIPNSIFITDSKTGQVRLCHFTSWATEEMKCGPWSEEE